MKTIYSARKCSFTMFVFLGQPDRALCAHERDSLSRAQPAPPPTLQLGRLKTYIANHNNKHDGGIDGCDGDACEEQLHTGRQGAAQPSLPLTGTADASMPQAPRAEGQVVEAVEKTWSLKRKKHQQQKRKQKKKKQNPSADSTEGVEGAAAVSQTSTPPLFGETVQSPPPPPTSEADQATRKGRTRRAKAGRRRRRNEPAAAENQAPLSTTTAESVASTLSSESSASEETAAAKREENDNDSGHKGRRRQRRRRAQRSEVQARQPEAQPRPESLSTAVQGLGTAVYAAVYARGGATQLSSAIGASLTLVVILGCFCCRHCGKAAEAA